MQVLQLGSRRSRNANGTPLAKKHRKPTETKLPQQGVVAKKTTTVKRKTNRYVPSEREKIWVFKVRNFRCLNSDHMPRILLIRH